MARAGIDSEIRVRDRRSAVSRVADLLASDFPGVEILLAESVEDLEAGAARAVVRPAAEIPDESPPGLDHFAFPEESPAHGLGLIFRERDDLLVTLRRFYLPPVVIAGAGPGGVGMMTVAATRALAGADLVLADCLCGEEVLRFVRKGAEIIPVGKRCGKKSTKQEDINARLLAEALKGRRVVRLKGGDPSVFGRLEEEIGTLSSPGLTYRVLPGIGAASGAAAFIGQPLTVREVASELILSTGRLAGGGKNPFPLRDASAPAIALYMSRKVLASRMKDLLGAGYPPSTPVVVVEKLGSPEARAAAGTIDSIVEVADGAGIGTPAVVLVGRQYGEPDHLPLFGSRIWLPAERETGEAQREELEALGAVCVQEPLIEPVALPVEEGALFARPFDWVLFTSRKSPDFLFDVLTKWGFDSRWLPKVAAIGGPTIAKLRARGIEPDLIPPEPTRAALGTSLIGAGLAGKRVLVPASAVAPDNVREALLPHAAEVVRVDLYTLRYPRVTSVPDADVVLFSSESTVRSARENGLVEEIRRRGMMVGGIGPATYRALEREGLPPVVRPDGTEPRALARAVALSFARLSIDRRGALSP